MGLGPPHVHPHEHLCPVLALGAAGAAVYLHHAVHGVFLLAQHVLELESLYGLYGAVVVGIDLLLGDHVVLVEVERELQLIGARAHLLVAVDPALQGLDLLHLLLCPLRVVPEVGGLCAQVFLLILHLLLVNVKVSVERVGALHDVFQLFCGNHIYIMFL